MNKNLVNHINHDIRQFLPSIVDNIPNKEIISNVLQDQYIEKAHEVNQLNLGNAGNISEDLTSILDVDDFNLKGIGLASIAGIHTYNGNYKKALAGLNEALNFKVHNDVQAFIFTEYANLLRILKRTDEALIIFNRASELTSNKNLKWRINTYIGYTLKYVDSERALKVLNKSADYYLKNSEYARYTTVIRHIGSMHTSNGKYKYAKKYFSLAEKIATQYSLNTILDIIKNDYAWILFNEKKYIESRKMYLKSLGKAQLPYDTSIILQNLGVIEFEVENFNKAIEYHKKSLQLTSNYHMYEMLFEDYYKIGLCYEYLGDYSNALYYYKEGYEQLQKEREELGIILLTGYRETLMDNYIRFLNSQPSIHTAALHEETFLFSDGKIYKEILDVFQENLLKIHRRKHKTIEQLCKSLDISLRLYFVYQNRFGLSRLEMKEKPNINPHFKNYLFSLSNLDWRSAKNRFDDDLYRYLLSKHSHNKTKIAKILEVSNLTVIKKTADLD